MARYEFTHVHNIGSIMTLTEKCLPQDTEDNKELERGIKNPIHLALRNQHQWGCNGGHQMKCSVCATVENSSF